MSNFSGLISEHIRNINKFIVSNIICLNKFFKRKKTIDSMYKDIIDEKIADINMLISKIESIKNKNKELINYISNTEKYINEKEALIKNIQILTSNKSL
ncbi:hypothetical protein ACSVC9_03975 [Clostridium sp. LBM24168]